MRLSLDNRAGRLLRRLPVVNAYSAAEIALLGLLALQCARLLWATVTPVGPVGDWRLPVAAAGRPATLALGDFDPFFRTVAPSATAVVVTSLAIGLFGVRVDRASGRDSAILSTPDGVQSSYAVGDTIMPGVVLAIVREDGVTIDRGGTREQIFLDQSVPAANATPAAGAAAGIPAAPAGFAPRLSNGQVSGFTISAASPPMQAAGLRSGDVVVSINGAGVSGVADAQALAGGLVPGSSISLGVERGGTVIPITVTVPR